MNNIIELYSRSYREKGILNSITKIFPQFERSFKLRIVLDKIIHADRYLAKYSKIANNKMKQYFDNQRKRLTANKNTKLLPEGRNTEQNTGKTMKKATFRDSIKVDIQPSIESNENVSNENTRQKNVQDREL